jgi:hypothetical protein
MKAVHFILKKLNYCKIIRAPKPHPQEEEEQDKVLKTFEDQNQGGQNPRLRT